MRDPNAPVTRARPSRALWLVVLAVILVAIALLYALGVGPFAPEAPVPASASVPMAGPTAPG